jgi:hypothetical protein
MVVGWKKTRVSKRFNDSEYVVEVRPTDPAVHLAKVLEVALRI